jgi:hypothetical protein
MAQKLPTSVPVKMSLIGHWLASSPFFLYAGVTSPFSCISILFTCCHMRIIRVKFCPAPHPPYPSLPRRLGRGGHELPKVSPSLAMPGPSTPCGRTISETALRPSQWWPTCRAAGLQLSFTFLDTPRRARMLPSRRISRSGRP